MRRLVTGHRRYISVNRCAYASSSERLNVTTQNGRAGSNCPAAGFSLATERGREGPKAKGEEGEEEKEEKLGEERVKGEEKQKAEGWIDVAADLGCVERVKWSEEGSIK